jgi:hypothetical protein
MVFKNIIYFFCCCCFSKKDETPDSYLTYNDIYKSNNYDTNILDYTTN